MGVMKNDDERIDERLERALRELGPVPPTPRDEMWARIQARRAEADVVPLATRRRTTWVPWSAAIAATLVIGIGLGRLTSSTPDGAPAATAAAATSEAVPTAYQVAATQHLQRTEVLLASLAVDDRAGGVAELSGWARELLTDTRLLLTSPAAEDAGTRRLLEDLELVLQQVAGIPESRAEQEVELIQDGINQSDVLLRLRAATAGPRLVGT
jgi:hypothetical protein